MDTIIMTVTKWDKHEAGPFVNVKTCIFATLFRRRFLPVEHGTTEGVRMQDGTTYFADVDPQSLYQGRSTWSYHSDKIHRSAVGKTITFRNYN